VEYTHNGEGWQAQTQFWPKEGVVCRLFPVMPWLLATPGWELDPADGTYEIVFEFSHPDAASHHLVGDEVGRPPAPVAETILEVGQTQPTPGKSSVSIVVRTNPGLPSLFMVEGQKAGEFAANPAAPSPRVVKIRWKQKGGWVSNIQAELYGKKLQADGGFILAGAKILFGGRGRYTPADYQPGKQNCLNILRLEYIKK
jgi:hypothetical protein